MKKILFVLSFTGVLLVLGSGCEKEEKPIVKTENPFLDKGENGFIMENKKYATPNAYIEIWGVTSDSLSSDFDISFTDGEYNPLLRDITGDSILVYFDANSPSLDDLSTGTYLIERTDERKPNNIVDAYIQMHTGSSIVKYPILEGSVEVQEIGGFYLVSYILVTVINSERIEVTGQYGGFYKIIDQRINSFSE